jgi:site-specific recombinase XerD
MVHRSLPSNSPERKKHAISGNTISALCAAAVDSSHSFFQLNRRLVMIKMLEMTGCRRSELVDIKVGDIKRALAYSEPFLTVPTIKRGGNKTEKRVVPVRKSDIEFVDDYIDKQRSIIIRRTCKKYNDDQKVLIGIQTGRGISAAHVARELRILGDVAGLSSESVAPHSFRHRFATKLFVRLLELHEFLCVDDFRRALINTESLKTKVMQWTGHRSVRSLERYIDAAFAEFTNEEDLMEAYLKGFR